MDDSEIIKIIQQFFISARVERKDALQNDVTMAVSDLASRNMLHSSVAVKKISAVYTDELKLRFEAAWKSIKSFFEKKEIIFSKDDAKEVEELLKQLVNDEIKNLSGRIDGRFRQRQGPLDFQNSILIAIASARNSIFPKISAELNFYIATKSNTIIDVKEYPPERNYVDTRRLEDLKSIKNDNFDLTRLIKLCEEINIACHNNCHMTIAMIMRAIIDHVPPIFGTTSFSEVANNYSGSKSFKDSMQLLDRSLRNVADSHLHVQIRRKETLPSFTQVNFMADLDLLLSEVIRILK
jgi:hypothetical protein